MLTNSPTHSSRSPAHPPNLGAFSGWAAGAASAPVCLGIGVATGGIGGVVCVAALVGTGAWVGTTAGGMGGEYIGELIYEATQP